MYCIYWANNTVLQVLIFICSFIQYILDKVVTVLGENDSERYLYHYILGMEIVNK